MSWAAALAMVVSAWGLHAEENMTEEQARQAAEKAWRAMEKKQGVIELPGNIAQLNVPDAFVYLSPIDTDRVLVDFWGNPPGGETLGMLLPARFSPFEDASWAVTIGYVDDGHVSDEDADKIEYQELLEEMQASIKDENRLRTEEGYPSIDLVGWAVPPHYDAESKKLHWAKELSFGGSPDHVLNYNLRVLGREGVLVLNFVAGMQQLPDINSSLERVAAMAEFKEGQRYSDYNPETDRLAAYGIGAVVAGGVMAKTGMWTAILLAAKKLWFLIAAAVIGAYKFFTRGKRAE